MPINELKLLLSNTDRQDLELAITTLKAFGATEIYLFGSIARGEIDDYSDWDFAVRGIPKTEFFRALAELLSCLHRPVDLVDFEMDFYFAQHVQKKREFSRVA